LQAEWLRLPDGNYALVHRRVANGSHSPSVPHWPQAGGQPILPPGGSIEQYGSAKGQRGVDAAKGLLPHERAAVINAIQRSPAPPQLGRSGPAPPIHVLALPPGPGRPMLPNGVRSF
jgi:hypothetical protein